METIERWIDTSREWVDPLYGFTAVVALGLLVIWLLNRPATMRDYRVPGGHYRGRITPKTLPKMLQDAPQPAETDDRLSGGANDDHPQRPAPEAGGAHRRLRTQRQQMPPRKMP